MATAEECREAFEKLTGRLAELDPKDRDAFFSGRSFSCHVSDLDVTFATRFGPSGACRYRGRCGPCWRATRTYGGASGCRGARSRP